MPVPNTVNDTVGYTPRNIYACEDVLVDIDDGNRLDIYGDVYLNGLRLGSSTTVENNSDFVSALLSGGSIHVVAGNYTGPFNVVQDGTSIILDEGTNVDLLTALGTGFGAAGEVSTIMTFAACPIGTTSFPGNFSVFNPGDKVAIRLGTAGSASSGNQVGMDFLTVATASTSTLTTTTGTRFPYENPIISKVAWEQIAGVVALGAYQLTLSTIVPVVGDILRLENITGVDSVDGVATAYTENVRVVAVSGSTVTLGTHLAYSYTDPIVSVVKALKNISINGGSIDSLACSYIQGLTVKNLRTKKFSNSNLYDFHVSDVTARGDLTQPIICNWSYCREGTITGLVSSGARGSTDNGAVKFMSPIDLVVSNVTAGDTYRTSGSQGIYPLFVDYFSTPYKGWGSGCSFSNLSLRKPTVGSDSAPWITGVRGCNLSNVVTDGAVRLQYFNKVTATNIIAKNIILQSSKGPSSINNFNVNSISVEGVLDSTIGPGICGGTAGAQSDRAIWVRADTPANTFSEKVRLTGITNPSTAAAETFIYLQSCTDVVVDGCSDRLGLASSFSVGSNTSGTRLGTNRFLNPHAITGSASDIAGAGTNIPWGVNTQTGTAYTIIRSDEYKILWLSNTGTITVTVDASFMPVGTEIKLWRTNTGAVTVVASGVTLRSPQGVNLRVQYSLASLIKLSTTVWLLTGDLV